MLKELSVIPSMSRPGEPLDNSPVETIFSILKAECIHRQDIYDICHANTVIDEFIEYYNYHRIQLKTK